MADTAIEWTDRVWNPTTGCDRVSPGCDHCYAMTMAKRLKGMGSAKYQRDGDPRTSGPGFGVSVHPDTLTEPLRWRKPQRIFVNSMSDLFHDSVPDEYIARVFAVMALAPQHTFQVLTKRHARMRSLLTRCDHGGQHQPGIDFRSAMSWAVSRSNPDCVAGVPKDAGHRVYHGTTWPLPNVWLGVSAENQQWADIRIPALLDTPAAVRFVSAEPLLGPIELNAIPNGLRMDGGPRRDSAIAEACSDCGGWGGEPCGEFERPHYVKRTGGIDWLIVGGESGHGARPMHLDWVRQIQDQCAAAGVAFLFKQHGEWTGQTSTAAIPRDPDAWVNRETGAVADERTALRSDGHWQGVWRVGKKAAGRLLDGREWSEYPEPAHAE